MSSLRVPFAARLQERRAEIEAATLARVYAISDPTEVEDPAYVAGLRAAVSAGLDYGLAAIEAPRARGPLPAPVPVELLVQARYAASSGVSLDTVLRRYFAGYTVLGDFIVAEAEQEGEIAAPELQQALRGEAALFDRLVAAVAEEYSREAEGPARGAEQRRAARVRMLLGGELVDVAEFGYDFDAFHIGAIAAGPGAKVALRDLATTLDRRLLAVCAGEGVMWAWLGGRCKLASREVLRLASSRWPNDAALALGEPGQGIEGWRLSHRQAKAALPVALRGARSLVAYTDVALFAAALSDEVLATSLRDTYLVPLERERDGGATARETLHAYFAAGRNASSAAASLGVSRQTVSIRLRSAEGRIGRPLNRCAAELETALRLRELTPDTVLPE